MAEHVTAAPRERRAVRWVRVLKWTVAVVLFVVAGGLWPAAYVVGIAVAAALRGFYVTVLTDGKRFWAPSLLVLAAFVALMAIVGQRAD